MHFDLYARADDLKGTADMAVKLGWKGIGMAAPWNGRKGLDSFKEQIRPLKKRIDIAVGVEIDPGKTRDFRKAARSVRKDAELIFISGGDLEANREALETPEVDALLRPWAGRKDCGLDHVMARLAKKNNVAVVFDFNELLVSNKRTRVGIMAHFLEAAKLVRKFGAPFMITSGAREPFDVRAPPDLVSFGKLLGFQDPGIKRAMSDSVIKENRKRLSGKWIMPGVELE